MSLNDELRGFVGKKRHYILLRISDMESDVARKLAKVATGTYNSWCHNDAFVNVHRRIEELTVEFKREAIQMLRRDNQLSAVLLERSIIQKMAEELESGNYEVLKTNLAREVYSKLITDLDASPIALPSWEERMQALQEVLRESLVQGDTPPFLEPPPADNVEPMREAVETATT